MTRRTAGAAGCALLTLGSAGCGTGADQAQVRSVATRFYAAVARHDGATACAQLSPDTAAQLAKDESAPCPQGVLKLKLRGRQPAVVRVFATSAEVVLDHGETIFLGDTRNGWRIDAVGCRPKGPGPYECETQA